MRQVLAEAGHRFAEGRRTVLFVDEVHRFNKAQQDAFLPHIERGTILFVGATTENPPFELNSALLSRCRVHVMDAVSAEDIMVALQRALDDAEHGLGGRGLQVSHAQLQLIARAACEYASAETGAPVLPALNYTVSLGHTEKWPGTFAIFHETLMSAVREIARWALASG